MTTPTLPGTIPGLLRRGSPVISSEHGEGVCIFTPRPGRGPAVGFMGPGDMAQFVEAWVAAEDLALDLSDPTGRAHAAWWWRRALHPDLAWGANPEWGGGYSAAGLRDHRDYAGLLAHLDLADPRLLPDGSRWVDAEALRLVCLHVAGVRP